MQQYLTAWDFVIGGVFLTIIYIVSRSVQQRNIVANPVYRYYMSGLFAKLFGGIGVCLIYTYYYGGGDTISFYTGGLAMVNLMTDNFTGYLSIMGGELGGEGWYLFNGRTGWPPHYMWIDTKTFFVIVLVNPIILIAGNSYMGATILLAWLSYTGVWRLYLLFCEKFPQLSKQLAIAILFMPSVVFWGSGMLKDTITFSATCWFAYAIYKLIITRDDVVFYAVCIAVSSFLLISIKPYIFIALMPGVLIWVSHERISKIKSIFVKIVMMPLILGVALGAIGLIFSQVGDSFGVYSNFDMIMETAENTRSDLIREQYGSHSYDVGVIDPSLSGLLSKAPIAIAATLFRPFLWEAGNIVMLFSAVENAFVLSLTVFLFLRYGPFRVLKYISGDPLLLFALSFSIFFAFAVGLTTANFGALVRYKIPAIPFYLSSLFILFYHLRAKYKGESVRS